MSKGESFDYREAALTWRNSFDSASSAKHLRDYIAAMELRMEQGNLTLTDVNLTPEMLAFYKQQAAA